MQQVPAGRRMSGTGASCLYCLHSKLQANVWHWLCQCIPHKGLVNKRNRTLAASGFYGRSIYSADSLSHLFAFHAERDVVDPRGLVGNDATAWCQVLGELREGWKRVVVQRTVKSAEERVILRG